MKIKNSKNNGCNEKKNFQNLIEVSKKPMLS